MFEETKELDAHFLRGFVGWVCLLLLCFAAGSHVGPVCRKRISAEMKPIMLSILSSLTNQCTK